MHRFAFGIYFESHHAYWFYHHLCFLSLRTAAFLFSPVDVVAVRDPPASGGIAFIAGGVEGRSEHLFSLFLAVELANDYHTLWDA